MRNRYDMKNGSDPEERLEALLHAFVLAVLAVGVLFGLTLARVADWGHLP